MHHDQEGIIPRMKISVKKSTNAIDHTNRIKGKNHMIIPTDLEKKYLTKCSTLSS